MKSFRFLLPALVAVLLCAGAAQADVQPGQTVDKSNAQNIKGLVPDFIFDLVNSGQMTMKIGKLDVNKKEYVFPVVAANWESNKGKYGLNDKNHLIEVASGKTYPRVVGIPFPDLDPKDPQYGYKAMYNWRYNDVASGNLITLNSMVDIDNGKLQRECVQEQLFYRPKEGEPLSDNLWMAAGSYKKPYDMSGLAVLDGQHINPDASKVRYAYMPGLRKLRRMAAVLPSSETQMGFSFAEDDIAMGGPVYNIPAANYKVLGVTEMLIPYVSEKPLQATKDNTTGKYGVTVTDPQNGVVLGAVSGQSGVADWVPTNVVWVKAPVVQMEFTGTPSAYKYGTSQSWTDAESGRPAYKLLNDKSGKVMKYVLFVGTAIASPEWKTLDYAAVIAKEAGRNHATMVGRMAMPGNKVIFDVGDKLNKSTFTKEGFARFTQ